MSNAAFDLQRLAGTVKDLQFNLDGIAKMAVSPRREKSERKIENKVENEGEKTPKNRSVSLSAVDTTPPVRDSGPGDTTVVKATLKTSLQTTSRNESASKSKLDQVLELRNEMT